MAARRRSPPVSPPAHAARTDAPLDYGAVAADWVRALRGKRSQASFSRRLGYSNSVVHRWECGRAWPTAARFLQACQRSGKELERAFTTFFRRRPAWLDEHEASSP